jgi:hypothetical protein
MSTALFLLKRREDYSSDPSYGNSNQIATGMYNSAKFVSDMLNEQGVTSEVVITIDGNTIDAAVMVENPKVVFIEGIWVTSAKFQELMSLARHAGRTWVVRIHSDTPFIATEGVAMERIFAYLELGVVVACNSDRIRADIMMCAKLIGYTDAELDVLLPFLPNYYPTDFEPMDLDYNYAAKSTIEVGCFGAFRPLKNHLQQAAAAIKFARNTGQNLRFHINTRMDQGGAPPQRNVVALFAALNSPQFQLVHHDWEDRETFLQTMSSMDILMQVSFSETFNIVAADAIYVGRPAVVSDEIDWAYPIYADCTDVDDIVKVMMMVRANPKFFVSHTRHSLLQYLERSQQRWMNYMDGFAS